MQDRFKFRAYFIPEEYYVKITQLNFDVESNITEIKFIKPKSVNPEGSEHICYQDQLNKFVFEQCTGCRDCKGDLIYEGDILEVPEDKCTNSHVAVRKDEEFQKWLLDGNAEADYEFYELVNRPCDSELEIDDVGIVGNIHENPELLEDNK